MYFLNIISQLQGYLRGTKIKFPSADDGSRTITIIPPPVALKLGTQTQYFYCVRRCLT